MCVTTQPGRLGAARLTRQAVSLRRQKTFLLAPANGVCPWNHRIRRTTVSSQSRGRDRAFAGNADSHRPRSVVVRRVVSPCAASIPAPARKRCVHDYLLSWDHASPFDSDVFYEEPGRILQCHRGVLRLVGASRPSSVFDPTYPHSPMQLFVQTPRRSVLYLRIWFVPPSVLTSFLKTLPDHCLRLVTVLLFYDYMLTLDKEARLFWKRKISGASLLFLFNRYLTVLTRVLDVVQFTSDMSDKASTWHVILRPDCRVLTCSPSEVRSHAQPVGRESVTSEPTDAL